MDKGNIFITGITGFLGSHMAAAFVKDGYGVIGLRRSSSDTSRCREFQNQIKWVNVDEVTWKEQVINYSPVTIIHAAWVGVSSAHRDDLQSQMMNINLLIDVLKIAQAVKARKFIGLGSQAEYGIFDGVVDESFPTNPTSAYGAAKLMSMVTVRYFCESNHIQWYWLRLFPCFGESESDDWLIPMLVRSISAGKEMDMTPGLQQYAYLYVGDEASWIKRIAERNIGSGIYNVSSKNLISLKALVDRILKIINPAENKIKLGALPYRPHQSMIMGGDTAKLSTAIGMLEESNFAEKLELTVDSILKKQPDIQK